MDIKKLIFAVSVIISASLAETANIATEHFKICETQQNEKIVIKYEDLISPEIDCINIYQSKAKEISKNELLLSSVVGHGTGFNVEKLFVIQIDNNNSGMNFIQKIFLKKKQNIKIYPISNEEIFNQLRKRTKFQVIGGCLKVIIDEQEKYNSSLNIEDDSYIDYCEEYFEFNLNSTPSVTVSICKKKKSEVTYPDFVGDVTFDIVYEIKNGDLKFSLKEPRIKI